MYSEAANNDDWVSEVQYYLDVSPEAAQHLAKLTARQRANVMAKIQSQLPFQPTVRTRNRKPMRPPAPAQWELRVGNLRVLYNVEEDPERIVVIRAIGKKVGNLLFLGKEAIAYEED